LRQEPHDPPLHPPQPDELDAVDGLRSELFEKKTESWRVM
jgi:hypothetical protein